MTSQHTKSNPKTVLASNDLPEVISEEEEQNKLALFLRAIQLDNDTLGFDRIKVSVAPFETIGKNNKNMLLSFRFTGAYTKDQENLIDPEMIQERDDIEGGFYVHHDKGFAGFMNCPGRDIYLSDSSRWNEVMYIEGEVYVSYRPGYSKLKIQKSELGKLLQIDTNQFTIIKQGEHDVTLTVQPEHNNTYFVEAYNSQGQRINRSSASREPMFSNDDMNEPDSYQFDYEFDGEIDNIEVYAKKPEKSSWHGFRTADKIGSDPDWDDFIDISQGPILPPPYLIDFSRPERSELETKTSCRFIASDSESYPDLVKLIVELPEFVNSALAEYTFSKLEFSSSGKSDFREVSFMQTAEGFSDFRYKDYDGHSDRDIKVEYNSSRFKGKLLLNYPSTIEWVKFTKDSPVAEDGHEISFNGGLLTYKRPEGYKFPKFGLHYIEYLIRHYNTDNELLTIQKFDDRDRNTEINIGVWGQVDYVELAIYRDWDEIEKNCDILCSKK